MGDIQTQKPFALTGGQEHNIKLKKKSFLLTSKTLKLISKFLKRKVTGGFKRKQTQLKHFQYVKSPKKVQCQALVAD